MNAPLGSEPASHSQSIGMYYRIRLIEKLERMENNYQAFGVLGRGVSVASIASMQYAS